MIKLTRLALCIWICLCCTACPKPLSINDLYPPQASLETDEAPHFKNSLEWWYFTGHLKDLQNDHIYGIEYVFFHFNPRDKNDYMMANFAISDPQDSLFVYDYEIIKRDDLLPSALPLDLEIPYQHETWKLWGNAGQYQLSASMVKHPNYSIDLATEPLTEVWMHGNGSGFQKYGPYATAGYYSYPKLKTRGTLELDGQIRTVEGNLWYDRQWNCIGVYQKQVAWDWMSIQLNDPALNLMLFQLYHLDRKEVVYGGSILNEEGENQALQPEDIQIKELEFWQSPRSKLRYPVAWQVTLPRWDLELKVKARFPAQELTLKFNALVRMHYWEGMCEVSGLMEGQPVNGTSYVEITNRKKNSL